MTFNHDPIFFLQMSDEQLREIDPAGSEGLYYPCMVAASGQTSDLSVDYSLLRRNPAALTHRNLKLAKGRREETK